MNIKKFFTFLIQINVSIFLVKSSPLNQHLLDDRNISDKTHNFPTKQDVSDTKHYNIRVVSDSNFHNEQETEEFSSFWEKVYDQEVTKHEREIKEHQRHHHVKKNTSKKDHKSKVNNQNVNRFEIAKDEAQKVSLKGKDNENSNKELADDKGHKGINNKNNNTSVQPQNKLPNLEARKKQHTLKPIGFLKENQIRKQNNQDDVHNSEPHNDRAVVKMRTRQRSNHHKEQNTHAESDDEKSRGVGKTGSLENSEKDQRTEKNEEVRDSEDRKRLPRNAAWFVQAALRMCETGQDPRCKKISVRKGNVKISIKIAED